MNREDTLKILAVLRGAYANFYRGATRQEAKDTVNLWQCMFADYDYDIVNAAVHALIVSDIKGYPPTIGQVMEKIRFLIQPQEMTENEAWAIVYKAICNSAYDSVAQFEALPLEIKSVVHDPAQLKAWATDPDFNIGVESSNFKRSFRARAAQIREFNALPSSIKQFAIEAGGRVDSDSRLALTGGEESK